MKKLLISSAVAAVALMGSAGLAHAGSEAYPPETSVAVLPPVTTLAPITVAPVLPKTGTDALDPILVGAAVVAVGGGLILVARRRRHPAPDAAA